MSATVPTGTHLLADLTGCSGLADMAVVEGALRGAVLAAGATLLELRLHGFGVKREGLRRHGASLVSVDSMAWSVVARRRRLRLPRCTHRARYCNNCLTWALTWREGVLSGLASAA